MRKSYVVVVVVEVAASASFAKICLEISKRVRSRD